MKNLIKKILKEEQDEFEWARGLDVNMAEKEIKKFFVAVEYDHGFEGPELYEMLVDAGVRDINKLQEIGRFLYGEVESVYDRGKDYGYENADSTCEGCCDDYVYYEDHNNDVENAKDEGYQSGFESAKSESESEIEELKSRIEELESRLNEG